MAEKQSVTESVVIADIDYSFDELQDRVDFYKSEYPDGTNFRLVREDSEEGEPQLKVTWERLETDEELADRLAEEKKITDQRRKAEAAAALHLERVALIHDLEEMLQDLYDVSGYRNRFVR